MKGILASKTIKGVPRRAVMEEKTKEELLIHQAISSIEALGADERLTKSQSLLQEASGYLSEWVDEQIIKRNGN